MTDQSPAHTTLRPVRLPTVRDRLARHWTEQPMVRSILLNLPERYRCWLPGIDLGSDDFAVMMRGGQIPPQALESFCTRIGEATAQAAMYWVSAEFSELAAEAAARLPDLVIDQHTPPAPSGLIVFEKPVWKNEWVWDTYSSAGVQAGISDVDAIGWHALPNGVWVTMYVTAENQLPGVPMETIREQVGFLLAHSPGGGIPFGPHTRIADQSPVMAVLVATWHLMQQPGVAGVTDGPQDKSLARKLHRAGRPYPEVNVVNLRQRPVPRGRRPVDPARKIDYRMLVAGHWKWVAWGPQHSLRRRWYVSEYLKGPDGAAFRAARPAVRKLE